MTPPKRPTLILLSLLATLLPACTNPSDPPPPNPPKSPESEVKAAYLDFWEMATRLASAPDADDPELTKRASGDALQDLVDGISTLAEQGRHSELGAEYGHDVLAVELTGPGTATLRDCAVDDSRIVDGSGQVVVEGVGTQLLSVTMKRQEGQWLVDSIEQVDSWNGAVPCQ